MSGETCAACGQAKDDDWVICAACHTWTIKRLQTIPKLHNRLVEDPMLKLPERGGEERRAKQTNHSAPANLHAISLIDPRTDVRSVLKPWVEDLFEQLQITDRVPSDVTLLCTRLVSMMPWCSSQHPASPDLVSEVKHQYMLLDRVVTGSRRPPSPIPCPVILPDTGPCTGTLVLHRDGTVSCRECESVWPFEQWQRLGALLAP